MAPGSHLSDRTEGITRVEDLPRPMAVARPRADLSDLAPPADAGRHPALAPHLDSMPGRVFHEERLDGGQVLVVARAQGLTLARRQGAEMAPELVEGLPLARPLRREI